MKTHKKAEQQDWHRADIKAALEKKGWSLRQLSISKGYHPDVFKNALARPYPAVERLIAAEIAVPAKSIWPTRYHEDGSAKSGRNERGIGVYKRKSTIGTAACNVEVRATA